MNHTYEEPFSQVYACDVESVICVSGNDGSTPDYDYIDGSDYWK